LPDQSYHAVLAVNDERQGALTAEDGGLRSLTAALRRGAKPLGNPAQDHRPIIMTTLYVRDGLAFREAESHHVIRQAQVLISRSFRPGAPVLSRPKQIREFLRLRLGSLDHEVFCCFYLDARRRLIAFEELFRGTVDCAHVHPRDVLRQALHHNATAVIFAHNHPSGALEASPADEFITRRLKDLLALMDVAVIDHFIVGECGSYSFAEAGLL
jgi:DNA repair protein RadC